MWVRRTRFFHLILGILTCVVSVFAATELRPSIARAASPTIVTLRFDDSNLDQYTKAYPILQSHQMTGTFFTITGVINDEAGSLTLPELQTLHNAGNEIAGHTVLHPDLTKISTDEATREICDSRDTLLNWGFPVTDFAYPFSAFNSTTEGIVKQCGYNSAATDAAIKSPFGCLTGCPNSESIPPADPYAVRSPDSIQDTWTVANIQSLVTQAESNGGGWVVLVFHHICDSACDPYSITPSNFSAVLDWLQTQRQNQQISIQNMNQVVGGPEQPAVSAPRVSPAPPGTNGVVDPSLEETDPYNPSNVTNKDASGAVAPVPYCWTTNQKGTNNASYVETNLAHTGSVAEQITITSFASGAARLITRQDVGQCAPAVMAGDTYLLSGWYRGTAPTRFGVWYRDGNGGWYYWTESPQFSVSSTWTQAVWATPLVPANAVALSFGMDIETAGTISMDDLGMVDSAAPTTVALTSPASAALLSGVVSLTASASSGIGIARVDYLVNGVLSASSTTAPFTATWDSARVADGPATIVARATDTGGNQTTSTAVQVTISNGATGSGTLSNGLQGYWKLDQGSGTSAADSTGHGYGGTTHGNNIWTAHGIINGGLQLDGTTNYVSTPYTLPTSGQITYAGWADPADRNGNYGLVGSSAGSGQGPLIQIPTGTNNVKFWRHTSAGSTTFVGVLPPPATWFEWVLMDDPGAQTTTLYIDGVSVGTNHNTAADTMAGNFEFGGYDGTSSLFKGLIDELAVWNRALTAAEVSRLWNNGVGLQYPLG
jgi:peptidoglycan/xylan/chitin deacetylase (PgdA/CDA1 family)